MHHLETQTMNRGLDRPSLAILGGADAAVWGRAAIVAIVLGSILTLANQQTAIFGDGHIDLLQLTLVYVTPFVVVTISQTLGIRRATIDAGHAQSVLIAPHRGSFFETAISHGIPARSFFVGIAVGSLSAAIGASATLDGGGSLQELQITPILQAFILPMIFSLISQAISYRRTTRSFDRRFHAAPQPRSV